MRWSSVQSRERAQYERCCLDLDSLCDGNHRSVWYAHCGTKDLVGLGDCSSSQCPMVHLFHQPRQTWFHCDVSYVVGLSRLQHDKMASRTTQAEVAQWIEQEPSNLLVAGSIPALGATVWQSPEAFFRSTHDARKAIVSKRT